MQLPTGLVCAKCGQVFGTIFSPPADKLQGLKAACAPCITRVTAEKGLKLDTPENWNEFLKD